MKSSCETDTGAVIRVRAVPGGTCTTAGHGPDGSRGGASAASLGSISHHPHERDDHEPGDIEQRQANQQVDTPFGRPLAMVA
jgi:hypothetical protein